MPMVSNVQAPEMQRNGPKRISESVRAAEKQVVVFSLADEHYAVDIGEVWEINTVPEITRIPRAPQFIEGVINLRGEIVPIMDLRKRLGLPARPHDRETRIMVVQSVHNRLGLIVDSVREVMKIPEDAIEPVGQFGALIDEAFLRGIVKQEERLVILLDMQALLDSREQDELTQLQPEG